MLSSFINPKLSYQNTMASSQKDIHIDSDKSEYIILILLIQLNLKMKTIILNILFLSIASTLNSCSPCGLADCDRHADLITIKLLKDGENAVYGPDATISKDSFRYYIIYDSSIEYEGRPIFLDIEQALEIYIYADYLTILEINGIRSDTFSITTQITSLTECCRSYTTTSTFHNGNIICTGECDGILLVEI